MTSRYFSPLSRIYGPQHRRLLSTNYNLSHRQMLTRVVLFTALFLFSGTSQAVYLLPGSYNHGAHGAVSTGGTITLDPPTRIVRRQVNPSSTHKPIISISSTNATNWANETNQLCMNAINMASITNPAGVVPCYNVLSFDPNTGMFLSEVRLFQIVSMVQSSVMASAMGSGVLFEFPHAEIHGSPDGQRLPSALAKRDLKLGRRQDPSMGQVNVVDAFYMNGTAEITKGYCSPCIVITVVSRCRNF